MESGSLPRADELRTRFSIQAVAVGLAMPLVSAIYLALLADFVASDWTKVIVAMTPLSNWLFRSLVLNLSQLRTTCCLSTSHFCAALIRH